MEFSTHAWVISTSFTVTPLVLSTGACFQLARRYFILSDIHTQIQEWVEYQIAKVVGVHLWLEVLSAGYTGAHITHEEINTCKSKKKEFPFVIKQSLSKTWPIATLNPFMAGDPLKKCCRNIILFLKIYSQNIRITFMGCILGNISLSNIRKILWSLQYLQNSLSIFGHYQYQHKWVKTSVRLQVIRLATGCFTYFRIHIQHFIIISLNFNYVGSADYYET